MENDMALYLLPYRGKELLNKLTEAPKMSNIGMESIADCCIPLIYSNGRSIIEPFGREKLIDSVLACCSDCRVVSLLRRQQFEKKNAAQTTKKQRHCKEQPCNYCQKVLEAQRYISKTLFFMTRPHDDSVRPCEAVDVYITGPNITMVAINSDSTKLPSTLESETTVSDDCWYGPYRMNVGDTLSLTNLHAKSKPLPSSNGCKTSTNWEDLKFLLCSNNGSNGSSAPTANTGHSNSDPSTLGKPTVQPKLWTSLNDIQCTLSRRLLHREQQSQHSFTYNNNIQQKCVEITSHPHDNSTSTEATMHQQPSHSEMAVEEESPMLTLPHFSCSSNWADSHHLNGSATEGVVDDDDDDVEAIGMHHLDGTPAIELDSSEDANNNNIMIRPLASMSFQELYELREEYAPNTFRHALLSIALMRAEKMKQEDTKSSQILLPWLLRDTVVVVRKKKPFPETTA